MRSSALAHSIIPCTTRAAVRTAARTTTSDEYDGKRVIRGVALGLLLSATAWTGLALALRAALG
jgi:hypothetical protein